MKPFKAAVLGATGYAGAEMIRRLLAHPNVELARICSVDHVGERIDEVHPNLGGRTDHVVEDLSPGDAARGMDVVLLGLPSTVSARAVPEVLAAGARVVDLSGAYRVNDAALYERFYGEPHPHPELLPRFVYGLPELDRTALEGATAVAAPGCFATAVELGLLPLARAGLLRGDVEAVGVTGSSGSGAAPLPSTHHPVRAGNLRAYKVLAHQHVPEIEATLRRAGAAEETTVQFVPVSAPLVRGILATSFAWLAADTTAEAVTAAFEDTFAAARFVRRPRGRLPEVIAVAGSNTAEVGFTFGPVTERGRLVTCTSAVDNLVKGGAGQVIQCMNLCLGVDEATALEEPGRYP